MQSNRRRFARGATLIEVMVALLVLAVGMLGFAGMQTKGIVVGRQAYMHSVAAFLAEDMFERMRANVAQSANYSMATGASGTDTKCDANNCTDADLVKWDQYKWHQLATTLLPGSTAELSATQGANPYVTAKITLIYTLNTDKTVDSDKAYTYIATTQIYYPN